MSRRAPILALAGVITLTAGACSSSSSPEAATTTRPRANDTRPTGPAATVVGPMHGGKGINLASGATGSVLPRSGWVETEFAVEGTATSYRSADALPSTGEFTLTPGDTAQYRTRIVVRRPSTPPRFNGTVVVEWLNVSGGLDAGPDFTYTHNELIRGGYAWVGVSAQRIGIEGGPVAVPIQAAEAAGAGKGLRTIDPARYSALHHPGDAFSYDIYTQVARALRVPNSSGLLGSLVPTQILAIGESQSAFALTTYVDGVQPLTHAFDGFLIHSRGGATAPLGQPDQGIDIAGTIGGPPTRLRTDGAAPVLVVETETDVLGVLNNHPAGQPDSARFRQWEIAGTAHADTYLVGPIGDQLGCASPLNAGPGHFVVSAALHHLDTWVRTGTAPPRAPRLALNATPAFVRDEFGNATGGVRTPLVDVPVDTLSGASGGGSIACILFGSTTPLTRSQLQARYSSRRQYITEYAKAADAAIAGGFVLPGDRAELLAAADPSRIPDRANP